MPLKVSPDTEIALNAILINLDARNDTPGKRT